MNGIKVLRVCSRVVFLCFGRGAGRLRLLQCLFTWVVRLIVHEKRVVVDVNGCRLGLSLDGTLDGEALGILFGNGYEPHMTRVFKTVVKSGMNVVDVGAHIGYYTVLASKLVGDKGNVWAFEPEPQSLLGLNDNLKLNGCSNVRVVPKALGDKHKETKLFLYGKFSGEQSLVNISKNTKEIMQVEVVPLDECVSDKVDVVKIDVDGGEISVLNGMTMLIQENPCLLLFSEVWARGLKESGHSCSEYWNILSSFGFRYIYLIDEQLGTSRYVDMGGLLSYVQMFGGANILCSKTIVLAV